MSITLSRRDSVVSSENLENMDQYSSKLIPLLMNTIGFMCTAILFIILESGIVISHKNGFYCNDESISYPFKEETISSGMMILVNVLVSICVVTIVEQVVTFENRALRMYSKSEQHWLPRLCEANHLWPIRATKLILILAWYIMANVILTDVIKLTVGRLRPHFLAVCNPNVTCSIEDTEYHLDYVCQDGTIKDENRARLSFPSGHASMSATVMGFIMVYVQVRCITPARFVLLKPIINLTMLILALWISMTRVSDYHHHLNDVLFGFVLGAIVGVLGGIHATKGTEILFLEKEDLGEAHALIDKSSDPSSYDSKSLNIKRGNQQERLSGDKGNIRDLEALENSK
jgi:phosphatidate phosphatase